MTQGVTVLAIQEGAWSNLPGKNGGPWDAYRHILLAAELTRRYDETSARSILYLHELSGDIDGQTVEEKEMDFYNNELGI